LTSRRRIIADTIGADFFDIVEENQEEHEALKTAGITIVSETPKPATPTTAA
jgi:hypothetical protein